MPTPKEKDAGEFLLASLVAALLLAALGDFLALPVGAWRLSSLGQILLSSFHLLWVPAGVLAVLAILMRFVALPRLRLWPAAVALGCGAYSYFTLTDYAPFIGYLPFIACWSAVSVFLAAGFYLLTSLTRQPLLASSFVVVSLLGALASIWSAAQVLDTRYPSLLEALYQVRFLLLLLGSFALLQRLSARSGMGRRVVGASTAIAGLALLLNLLLPSSAQEQAMVRDKSTAALVQSVRTVVEDRCEEPPVELTLAEATAVFAEASGLPVLPEYIHVDDYNIVLLTVESTRADHANPQTTPFGSLRRLGEKGAWTFERAYAPATRTWLSLSSLYSMTFASHAHIETKVPQWTGELLESQMTVSELFLGEGFATDALFHGLVRLEGVGQGFSFVHTEPANVSPRHVVDQNLAARSIDRLAAHQRNSQKFFLWSFFVSPHFPYLDSEGNASEQYARAVRHADSQVQRILDFLEVSGLADSTIVILTADHGEELFEKTGRHGNSLSANELHVPLAVRIPGVQGGAMLAPTSSTYVLPWLLQTANSEALRKAAQERIRSDLAPAMQATSGAVVAEIFDANEDQTSLIWRDSKIDYSARSGQLLVSTPVQVDGTYRVFETSQPAHAEARKHLERFRKVRACHRHAHKTRNEGTTEHPRGVTEAIPYRSPPPP